MRWPRTLLPASSSGGENVPTPPLPGDTVTRPPLTPLLPGRPDVVEPVARALVEPGGGQDGQHALAAAARDRPLARQRVDAAIGQRGAHDGQVAGADAEGALAGVHVGGDLGVAVHAPVAVRGGGRCRGCGSWSPPRTRTPRRPSPAAARRTARGRARCDSNFSSALSPGTRLVVASAPAFTMGFMVRSALSSMAMTESKGSPVLLTPSLRRASSGPRVSQTRANTKSLEMLWMVNSCSASPMAKTPPLHAGHADAEGVRRGLGQRRDVVGHPPLVEMRGSGRSRSSHERLDLAGRTGGFRSRPARPPGRSLRRVLSSSFGIVRVLRRSSLVRRSSLRRVVTSVTSSWVIGRELGDATQEVPLPDLRGACSSSGESLSMRNWLKARTR